jgi:hypothetical protein
VTRTIQELAAVRDAIRRQWMQPIPPAFPDDPELADTSEDMLALLARQRLIGSRLLHALQSGNPDAINEAIPRGPAGLPRGTGEFFAFSDDNSTFNPDQTSFFGPIEYPYIVRELAVSAMDAAAAPAQGNLVVELWTSGEGPNHLNRRPVGAKLWPGLPAPTSEATTLITGSSGPVAARYPINKPVLGTGLYLAVFFDASSATLDAAAVVTIERVAGSGGQLYADLLPAGRSNLNPSTRPPAPRLTTPQHPRGAIIRVTQGGRILSERRISWEALDASLRAKWFNQQVGEPQDPSLIWIR